MDCTNDLDNQQPYSPIVAPTITVEPTMTPVAETTSPATIGTSNTTSPSSIEIVVTTVTETIPRNKFELLTWETCDKDEEDVPIGFEGRLWNNFSVLKLRNICSKLQVYGIKNAKKENIIESIVTTYQNTKAYSTIRKSMTDDNQQGTRKEVQCPYRLMNILFSDDFVEDFSTIGNGANRRLLDTGKAGNEEHFWRKVKDAYMISKADYNVLQFREDDVFASENIYPGKIVAHEWKKLRSIWKGVNADYKVAKARFTQSGTHDSCFYGFCAGKKEAYYLRLHLEDRPSLNEMVEADLPEACNVASSTTKEERATVERSAKKRAVDTLAECIKDSFDKNNVNDLMNKKIEFMLYEAGRKERVFNLRLEESKLAEWQSLRDNIKQLRKELFSTTSIITIEEHQELKNDIKCLLVRKNKCAKLLGMTTPIEE
jgi:hypothetical protein